MHLFVPSDVPNVLTWANTSADLLEGDPYAGQPSLLHCKRFRSYADWRIWSVTFRSTSCCKTDEWTGNWATLPTSFLRRLNFPPFPQDDEPQLRRRGQPHAYFWGDLTRFSSV